jgi:hypothetical protein
MNLFIALATYNSTLTVPCFESLLRGSHILRDAGHAVKIHFHNGNPYIDMARNACVKQFLASDCTDMIFIDADVGYEDDALLKLVKHDKELIAGIYPFKQDKLDFPVNIYFDPITNNCKEESTGLVTATMVPTGFMRIKRTVFEQMIKHYEMEPCCEGLYHFFDTGVQPGGNKWYGEDYLFCNRWVEMGGKIFIEPDITFKHTGFKHFTGNYHNYLMGKRVSENLISGWTSEDELTFIGDLARKSQDVVEVGSWKGRSTKAILDNCRGKVYAVDHWNGSASDISCLMALREDVFSKFFDNVGHYPNLEVLRGDSIEMANRFNGNKVDMVFIDADHSYESVKADIEAWMPVAKKYICGHDYKPDWPGVVRAVNEKFPNVKVVDSVWLVELES